MNGSKNRLAPNVEALERIELLAATLGIPLTGAPTGLGNAGSASVSDVQSLQQDASGGLLEQYISAIESVDGKQASVRAYAQSVVTDHQYTNFDLQQVAGSLGVSLPSGIALPTDSQDAKKVLSAVKGKNLDKTYLQVMEQINAQDVADDQHLVANSTVAAVRSYAQLTEAYDQSHLQGAQQLLKSPKSTYQSTAPTPPAVPQLINPPSTTTPDPSDASALQQDASGGYLEQLISEVEVIQGKRSDAQQFAQGVVGDHQVTNFGLLSTAAATSIPIQAGITQPSDIQDAQEVLKAVGTNRLDGTYLKVMAKINNQDIQSAAQLAASTKVPLVASYAQESYFYDNVHYADSVKLTQSRSSTFTPGA